MTALARTHTTLPETREALEPVAALLHSGRLPALVGQDGSVITVPPELHAVLRDAVDAMLEGKAVTLAPQRTVMTTQEAAEFLSISRPTLVHLLEQGAIPFTRPGRHRRVALVDLIAYQESVRSSRRASLDDLTERETSDGPRADSFVDTR